MEISEEGNLNEHLGCLDEQYNRTQSLKVKVIKEILGKKVRNTKSVLDDGPPQCLVKQYSTYTYHPTS